MSDLSTFCTQFQQDILAEAQAGADGLMLADIYTSRIIEYLTAAGEIDDGEVCYHRDRVRGIEVSGYTVDDEDQTASLFLSIFNQRCPPESVGTPEVEGAFKRMRNFVSKSSDGYADSLEPASPVRDMALRIHDAAKRRYDFRLYVLTDGVVARNATAARQADELIAGYEVWDAERLFRCVSSGTGRERIDIDFSSLAGAPISCLHGQVESADYDAYLMMIPGTVLAEMYGRYGSRLLELNVRSFLQLRGKVNKGIRETILNEPDHFLAYNNGISATASEIELVSLPRGGGLAIRRAIDFQIVNGGQTTASIHHAVRVDKADISRVNVQAKLTVVPADRVGAFVPLVSRYANTQNKVNEADFSANDPFHVKLEELSRTIWAPAVQGTARQTRWFYERARGQYQDALSRAGTAARKNEFKIIHPPDQKFTKTDLAKFENSWDQAPEIVSRGAEKNFREFAIRLAKRGHVDVDEAFFHHVIGRAILFRRAERLISGLKFPGYRANVVTYTVAYLSHITAQKLDLEAIWRRQDLSPALGETILDLAPEVYAQLINPPSGGNVTEWCKKAGCWDRVQNLNRPLPASLRRELQGSRVDNRTLNSATREEERVIEEVAAFHAEFWFKLAAWARETDNLQPWQRGIAHSMGRYKTIRREPSRKQAAQAILIIREAERLGYRSEGS
jgi:hypothetical protein